MLRTRLILFVFVLLLSPLLQAAGSTEKFQVSREQAASLAQQQYPGKIVKMRAEKISYRIRVLQDNGRVITVLVDGQTGRVKKDGN